MPSPHRPPAFPCTTDATDRGMTLRDYFAAQALPACIHTVHLAVSASGQQTSEKDIPIIANIAYELADAMLKAREQETT